MRRTLLLLLLAIGCASGGGASHRIKIDVTEVRNMQSRPAVSGPHMYRITIRNVGEETVTIDTIRIDPAGTNQVSFVDNSQEFGDAISPQQEVPFDMFITAEADRSMTKSDQFALRSIDSLQVVVGGRAETTGSFVESGTYPIGLAVAQ